MFSHVGYLSVSFVGTPYMLFILVAINLLLSPHVTFPKAANYIIYTPGVSKSILILICQKTFILFFMSSVALLHKVETLLL